MKIDALEVKIPGDTREMAAAAALEARDYLSAVLGGQAGARVILATGNSQMEFLDAMIGLGGIDWSRITLFHMDEYLGIDAAHSASFRRYMKERVEARVHPRAFHYMEGDALEPIRECDRYAGLLEEREIDLCCLGIGENGHLAFNDPPVADFHDERAVKIVKLDRECRRQQVGEGHFPDLGAVPQYALTLTIPALCRSRKMLCIVPEERKARAVRDALQGPIGTACPASILREQAQATLYLDRDSASLLDPSASLLDRPGSPG